MTITLIPETGSGTADANCYEDAAYVTQYHADRGNAYWAAVATEDQKACIIRATDYIEKRFKRRFRGYRMSNIQALAWPRIGAYDDDDYSLDGVPVQVKKAMAEYALRAAIYNVLAPDPIRTTPSQDMSNTEDTNGDQTALVIGPIKSKTEKVGPLEESVTYDGSAALAAANTTSSRTDQSTVVNDLYVPQYPEADLLLEELFDSSMTVKLERA